MNYTMQIHFKLKSSPGHAFLTLTDKKTGQVSSFGFTNGSKTALSAFYYSTDGRVETNKDLDKILNHPDKYGLVSSRKIVLSRKEYEAKLNECNLIKLEANVNHSLSYLPFLNYDLDTSDKKMNCIELVQRILNVHPNFSKPSFRVVSDYFTADQIEHIASKRLVGSFGLLRAYVRHDKLPYWEGNSFVTKLPTSEFYKNSDIINIENLRREFKISDGEIPYNSNVRVINTTSGNVHKVLNNSAVFNSPTKINVLNGKTVTSYNVQKGDTIWGIAQKYGVTQEELAAYNNIDIINGFALIKEGQSIKIPGQSSEHNLTYVNRDQCDKVAKSFGKSLGDYTKGLSLGADDLLFEKDAYLIPTIDLDFQKHNQALSMSMNQGWASLGQSRTFFDDAFSFIDQERDYYSELNFNYQTSLQINPALDLHTSWANPQFWGDTSTDYCLSNLWANNDTFSSYTNWFDNTRQDYYQGDTLNFGNTFYTDPNDAFFEMDSSLWNSAQYMTNTWWDDISDSITSVFDGPELNCSFSTGSEYDDGWSIGIGSDGFSFSGGGFQMNIGGNFISGVVQGLINCFSIFPIVIDMDNDGVELVEMDESSVFFDMDDDGYRERTGWVGADDALLCIDLGGDGVIDQAKEIAFKLWAEEAETDLEGLKLIFDSNSDGVFDSQDGRYDEFYLWQDSNLDGVTDSGELTSLADAGLLSINVDVDPMGTDLQVWEDKDGDGIKDEDELTGDGDTLIEDRDGNVVLRDTNITWNGDHYGRAYDTTFKFSAAGMKWDDIEGGYLINAEDQDIQLKVTDIEDTTGVVLDMSEAGFDVAYSNIGDDHIFTTDRLGIVVDGDDGDDTLEGGDGTDWLKGGAGSDVIRGGKGSDVLFIDAEDLLENIDGGEGDDVAWISTEQGMSIDLHAHNLEAVYGNAGNDVLTTSGETSIQIHGGAGDDELRGGAGDDVLMGGEGNDTLIAGDGDDSLFIDSQDNLENVDGGAGDDALFVYDEGSVDIDLASLNVEKAKGNKGDDKFYTTGEGGITVHGGAGNDTIHGNKGEDALLGGIGNDVIYGKDGDDRLDGGAGSDTLSGGRGNDLYVFGHGYGNTVVDNRDKVEDERDMVWLTQDVSLDDLDFEMDGHDLVMNLRDNSDDQLVIKDWFKGAENRVNAFLLSDMGNDNPQGVFVLDQNDNTITLDGEEDWRIFSLGGDDDITGHQGDDSLFGGNGLDTIRGEGGDDYLLGEDGADEISGGAGRDYLDGGSQNDVLNGGDGDDYLIGGSGADTLNGGCENDTALYLGSSEGVAVDLSTGAGTAGDAKGDSLDSIENLVGSSHGDTLTGNDEDNLLDGRKGDDSLSGGAGDDVLIGGAGADVLIGGDGVDAVAYSSSREGVNVDLTAGTGLGGDAEGDTLSGIEEVVATEQNDTLRGDEQDNMLFASYGDDEFVATAGNDTMYGGAGDDKVTYSGNRSDYVVSLRGSKVLVEDLASGDVDALSDVETIEFADETLNTDDFLPYARDGKIVLLQDDADGVSGQLGDAETNAATTYDYGDVSPEHGTLTLNSDGSYTYVADAGYTGTDRFSFKAVDENGVVNVGSMEIDVKLTGESDQFAVNTHIPGHQYEPSITSLPDGGFVAVWRDDSGYDGGAAADVFGQMYDAHGQKVGDEFMVNEHINGSQFRQQVKSLADGGFVVVWRDNSGHDGAGNGVFGQRFNADGEKVGEEFNVNTHGAGNQDEPSIGALVDGGFVVAWRTDGALDGNADSVYAQRFGADGGRIGEEFQVNSFTNGIQFQPEVIGLNDGGFVIAFASQGRDGSGYGVFGQRYDEDGEALGGEFQINSYMNNHQYQPTLAALENGGFVAIWSDNENHDGSGWGVFGQRFEADGSRVGDEFLVNTTTNSRQYQPDVASLSDGGFVVVWHNNDNTAYGKRYDANGVVVEDEFPVITHNADDTHSNTPVVAGLPDGQFVVLSASITGGNWDVSAKRFGAHGQLLSGSSGNDVLSTGDFNDTLFGGSGHDMLYAQGGDDYLDAGSGADVIDGGEGEDTLSYACSNDAVTVDVSTGTGSGGHAEGDTFSNIEGVEGSVFSDSLTGDGGVNTLDGGYGDDTLTGGLGDDSLVGGKGVDTAMFSGTLADYLVVREGSQTTVEHRTTGEKDTLTDVESLQFSDVTYDLDSAAYAMDGRISLLQDDADGVTGRFGDPNASGVVSYAVEEDALHGTVTNNGDGTYTYVADAGYYGADSFVFKAVDENGVVNVARMSVDVLLTGDSGEFTVNTHTAGNQMEPQITSLDNGGFVVVWRDTSGHDGSGHGVFGQVYDKYGEKVGSEFNAVTGYSGGQYDPAITSLVDGGFVIAWSDGSGRDGQGVGVFGQRFDQEGNKVGSEFQANTVYASAQNEPSVGSLANGGFVIAWHDGGNRDGDNESIYAQRFDGDGFKIGEEFHVNTYENGVQFQPEVVGLWDGTFVIAFVSNVHDGDDYSVWGQRYDEDGDKIGGEFQINTSWRNSQFQPSMTALADGGFMVVWGDNYAHDGSGWGVFGQRFDADGNSVGEEFIVNTTTASDQYCPSVTALEDGGFAVIWHNHDNKAYFQRFDVEGDKVGDETLALPHNVNDTHHSQPGIASLVNGQLVLVSSYNVGGHWDVQAKILAASEHDFQGTSGNDVLSGGDLNDTLSGGAGHDNLYGQSGDDEIAGGLGADVIDGGAGTDNASYSASDEAVTVDLSAGTGSGGHAEGDVLSNVENVTGSIYSDSLTGDGGVNTLDGGYGDDTLSGGLGDDLLVGGKGVDTAMFSGTLADYLVVREGSQTTVEHRTTGEKDTLTDVESLQFSDVTYDLDSAAYAMDGRISLLQDDADGVTGRFGDPNASGVVSYAVEEDALHGTVTNNGDGTYTYVADAGYYGADSFVFKAVDENGVVNVARMSVDVLLTGDSGEFTVNTHTAGNQMEPQITSLDNGGFVVVWRDTSGHDGSGHGVFGQVYDKYGEKVGSEFNAVTGYSGGQYDPAITSLVDGGFVIAWSDGSGRDGQGVGVFGQRFDQEGNKVGSEFQANTVYASAQNEPSVGSLANGGFVIAWHDGGNRDGDNESIYAQRFDGDGFKIGEEFHVNTYENGVQFQPEVVGLWDGTFVIAFVSNVHDGDDYSVWGQRYDEDGDKIGGEFQINTSWRNSQFQPSMTALADGGFMVVWGDNYAHDGSGWGVFGQRFDADGNSVGEEFIVNTTTASDQYCPSVTALEDGGFAVIWHNHDNKAYFQRFDVEGDKVGDETLALPHNVNDTHHSQPGIASLVNGQLVLVSSYNVGGHWDVQAKILAASEHDFQGTSGNDVLSGGDLNDTLSGGAGHDNLYGQSGDDEIAGGLGADVIDGGAGTDNASYSASDEAVTVDLSAGTGSGGHAEDDVLSNVENITGSIYSDSLTGSDASNLLDGGFGDDTLTGGLGDDSLVGGKGVDMAMFSGTLADYLVVREGSQTTVEHRTTGEKDTLTDVESLQFSDVAYDLDSAAYAMDGRISLLQDDVDGITGRFGDPNASGVVSYAVEEDALHGTVTNNGDGTYTYVADAGYYGADSFVFKAVDENGVVNVARMSVDVLLTGDSGEFTVNTHTSGSQTEPQITSLDNGGFVVVWRDTSGHDGSGHGVFGQVYDKYGEKVGDEFNAVTGNSGGQYDPAITSLVDGGFVIAWSDDSGHDGQGVGVIGQRFDQEGNKVGSEFQANTVYASAQNEPSVGSLSNGGFVIAWHDGGNRDGDEESIYAQRFDADGGKIGDEFHVNFYTSGVQFQPEVVGLNDGGFVIAFSSQGKDGNGYGVFGQRYDEDGEALGDEFQISSHRTEDQFQPTLAALEDGGFVAVWSDNNGNDGSGWGVFGQRFGVDGSRIGDWFIVNTTTASNQNCPSVTALEDGGFAVIWHNHDNQAYFQRFDAEGNKVGDEILALPHKVNDTHHSQPGITSLKNGQLVTISAHDVGGNWDIHAKVFEAAEHNFQGTSGNDVLSGGDLNDTLSGGAGHDNLYGQSGDDEITGGLGTDVIDGGAGIDNASYSASDEAVTVDLSAGTGSGGHAEGDVLSNVENVTGSIYSDSLTGDGGVNTLDGGYGDDTLSGGLGDDLLVGGKGVDTVVFSGTLADYLVVREGSQITVEHRTTGEKDILTDVEFLQFSDATYDVDSVGYATDGRISLLQDDVDGITGRFGDPNASGVVSYAVEEDALHGTVTNNGDGTYTYVADAGYYGADSFVFKAVDENGVVNVARMSVDVLLTGDSGEFTVNTHTSGSQTEPQITSLDNGGFVVVWRDTSGHDGSGHGVFGQVYDQHGEKVGDEFNAVTGYSGGQYDPTIASLVDGGFVIAWSNSSGRDGAGTGVFGQRFDQEGNKVGNEFQANTVYASAQYEPSVGSLADGGFVIAWSDGGARDGSDESVYAQRFDADGFKIGEEFQVNTYTSGNQLQPEVIGLGDGGFVIAFASQHQDGDGYGVFGQRYDEDGDKVGEYFQINTHTPNSQYQPTLTALADGGFVAVWADNGGHDGSGWGLFGQRFDADGNSVGEEFIVNTTTASDQYCPSVTALEDGGFAVIWHNHDNWAHSQHFDAEGNSVGDEKLMLPHGVERLHHSQPGIVSLKNGQMVAVSAYNVGGHWDVRAKILAASEHDLQGTSGNDVMSGGDLNDTLSGGAGHDNLYGQSGDDEITGGLGTDVIDGGAGSDTIDGGAGLDKAIYSCNKDDYQIQILENHTTITHIASGEVDTLRNVETVVFADQDIELPSSKVEGGTQDDAIVGGESSDIIDGGGGRDNLKGLGGDDTLLGGDGEDCLHGDDGSDSLSGGEGNDVLFGNDDNDTLHGGAGNDKLYGGLGADSLLGGEGDDYFVGGAGADSFDGGTGSDTVVYTASSDGVRVDLSGSSTSVDGDTFDSVENVKGSFFDDTIIGSSSNNYLNGLEGNDVIEGHEGDDTLIGGSGTDVLTGGAGADVFVIEKAAGAQTTVADFVSEHEDKIDVSAFTEIESYTRFKSLMTQDGDNIAVDMGDGQTLFLNNTDIDSLDFHDFIVPDNWNEPPVISEAIDLGSVSEDGSLIIAVADLLANASDVDGDSLSVSNLIVSEGNGSLADNGDGTWTFTPDGDWNGSVGLSYDVTDGELSTAATAGVTVTAVNDAPVTTNVAIGSVLSDSSIVFAAEQILTETSDVDSESLNLSNLTLTSGSGTLSDNGDGTWTYTAPSGWTGTISLSYSVGDGVLETSGSATIEVVDTGSGSNVVQGSSGDDTIQGSDGNDMLLAGDGNDNLAGGGGLDKLFGQSGNDEISGGTNHDTLSGGAGNDTLDGGSGSDVLDGGSGDDVFTVTGNSNDALDDSYQGGSGFDEIVVSGGDFKIDDATFSSIERIDAGGNSIVADDSAQRFDFSGTEFLNVASVILNGGNDTLYSSAQSDVIQAGSGHDLIYGNQGNDSIFGGNHSDTVYGGEGDDTLDGSQGADFLYGGAGNDTLIGGSDCDYLDGGEGDDVFTIAGNSMDAWQDHIQGGSGFDQIIVSGGDFKFESATFASIERIDVGGNSIVAGNSSQNIDYRNTELVGVTGINLNGGNDTLYGSSQNDVVHAGNGHDFVDGGRGSDSIFGGDHSDTLYGGVGDDTLDGHYGSDYLYGGAGNDTLIGGGDCDHMDGGDGDDVFTIAGNSMDAWQDHIQGGSGFDQIIVSGGDFKFESATFASIERIDVGGNSIVAGNSSQNIDFRNTELVGVTGINLNGGNDTLYGSIQDDVVHAGSGSDLVHGNQGNDSIFGGDHSDTLYGGVGDDTLNGHYGADRLYGGEGNDTLIGGSGSDVLDGGSGDDVFTVDGNSNYSLNDHFKGGSGFDQIIVSGCDFNLGNGTISSIERIDASGNSILADNSSQMFDFRNTELVGVASVVLYDGDDTLHGSSQNDVVQASAGNDLVYGNLGHDNIDGGGGNDTLYGGDGNDTLYGGDGNDTLSGGIGGDTYHFNLADSIDVINDFGGDDRVLFGESIDSTDLWFTKYGTNLTVGVIGTEDKLTIEDWYSNDNNQIEEFQLNDGSVLLQAQLQQLVDAMSSYTPESSGTLTVPSEIQDNVQSLITASWQK